MIKIRKKFLSMLVIAVSVSLLSSSVFAAEKSLSVTPSTQEYSQWCWAACAQMNGKYYYEYKTGNSINVSQSQIVYHVFNNYGDNPANTIGQMIDSHEYATLDNYSAAGATAYVPTYSEVKAHINSNKPMTAVSIAGTQGHATVIYGYADKYWAWESDRVKYINPQNGNKYTVSYTSFCSGAVINGDWTWSVYWTN